MSQDGADGKGERPEEEDRPPAGKDPIVREVDAWAVISYLLAGVLLYGGLGWLLDLWLGTRGFVAGGIVLGAAGGIVLVWLRYSKP